MTRISKDEIPPAENLAPVRGIRDIADMKDIAADEHTIIERLSEATRGFASHRRLHEHKARPEITKILLVAEDGASAILHCRDGGHWREVLVALSEALPGLGPPSPPANDEVRHDVAEVAVDEVIEITGQDSQVECAGDDET